MLPGPTTSTPLVSVIIPCYNQGHYLTEAVNSVLAQTYQPVEIVVVDDGSTDNTRQVAETYTSVKYVYQKNGGLSAARNAGIDNSHGEFLIFLDSDDWLLPEAIAINIKYLKENPTAAFVSGSHKKIKDNVVIPEIRNPITLHPYHQLLHQNYIGMIAAVMFRRWIFDRYRYDTSLHSCEDYDLYLKITRDHPVIDHVEDIALYRIHGNSISGNISLMLQDVTKVMMRQKNNLHGEKEEKYLAAGLNNWKKYYYKKYYLQLSESLSQNRLIEKKELSVFSGQSSLYLQYLKASIHIKYTYSKIKRHLKRY